MKKFETCFKPIHHFECTYEFLLESSQFDQIFISYFIFEKN